MERRPEVGRLIEIAIEALPGMQLASGLFCHERVRDDAGLRGSSLRYTAIGLLGLLNAERNGYAHRLDCGAIEHALFGEPASRDLTPGDYGLLLWIDARAGRDRGRALVHGLLRALARAGGLPHRDGMELGWIVTGLAHHSHEGGSRLGERLLRAALDQLLESNLAASGLFVHSGGPGPRRRFPNFATEIYGLLALVTAGRLGLDARALPAARAAADTIVSLQRPDGGWPWIVDAFEPRVVEPYELYSVHQDAMAPMALLPLAEETGSPRYVEAVAEGLEFEWGRNPLGRDMVDGDRRFIYRSIRRRRPLDRLMLYVNTLAAARPPARPLGVERWLELNPTTRPYHLGWILEAWCGREAALPPIRADGMA